MEIFDTVLPVLLVVLTGFIITRRRLLTEQESETISKVVFTFVIPSLLFIGTAKARFPGQIAWHFMFSYFSAVIFIFLLSTLFAKYVLRFSTSGQSVFAMGASYSNVVVIGIPIAIHALGDDAMLPVFMIVSIHNLVLFSMGIIVAERSKISMRRMLQHLGSVVKRLLLSPITGSIIAGGFVNIIDIPIYKPVDEAITMMSKAAVPMALFVLGTSLGQYKIAGQIKISISMVIFKMLLLPFIVWFLAFRLFSVDTLWASTAVLISAMPVGINAYVFSKQYSVCEAPVAAGIVISSTGCVITITLLLFYLRSLV